MNGFLIAAVALTMALAGYLIAWGFCVAAAAADRARSGIEGYPRSNVRIIDDPEGDT